MRYDWKSLYADVADCRKCDLCEGRKNVVLGEGDIHSPLMIVGEGPGHDEDVSGRPFVGPAGQLLDKMLAAIDVRREDTYICNIVKCRPPGNRTPMDAEAAACLPYLRAQYALIRPRIILILGGTAAKYLYGADFRVTRDHGKWLERNGVLMLPTFHPSALLRNQDWKRPAWEDMKALRAKLDELQLFNE